ncbi:hypothetical protein VNO78_20077 [Psophocarpus tetragonolobus]|uniref:Uncharacterized protein n=1 Tax=Psophocarpus tetragonolobus TaxID=3891 RepID=A0AAN9XGU5_PSOTE
MNVMYPKVKVRQDDDAELGLKAFLSLYFQPSPSPSPEMDQKVVVKVPKCYVPHVPIPRVPVTDDSEEFNLESDSSRSEKDDNTSETKVNIRAGPIPRPRAVISSPDNDILLGNRNKSRDGRRLSASKDVALQNRHVHCKVKSLEVVDNPPDTRKHTEPETREKIDLVGKKKVHKGSKKVENAPWKF